MPTNAQSQLAVNGGAKVRTAPWPPRRLFTEDEKQAAMALFDHAIETGEAFSYGGDAETAYCEAFAEYMGGGYADGVNSGSSAIYVALRALDLEPFTEVIVPPVTDMGGVMPVPLINCIPVPADTAPNDYNCGPAQIEARITERTSAIIAAHIGGMPLDMDPIMAVARARSIPVLEDCAQAHGAKYKGKLVGTMGDIAAFSTMSGKHHATAAQGGVVYARDERLYWRSRQLSDRGKPFGIEGETDNVTCTLNLNLNDLAGAVGQVQLRKLPDIVARCRRASLAIGERCQALQSVEVQTGDADFESAFWFLVFRLRLDRVSVDIDTFVAALQAEGIPATARYTTPFTIHPWYKKRTVFGASGYPWTSPQYQGNPDQAYPLPNMEAAHECLFLVRVHENLTEQEADDIAAALGKLEAAYRV